MSSTDYSGLIQELEQVGKHPPRDETQRRDVAAALRKAYASLETPLDIVHRIAYSVSLSNRMHFITYTDKYVATSTCGRQNRHRLGYLPRAQQSRGRLQRFLGRHCG